MREILSPAEWLRKSGAQRDVIDGLARFTEWRALYEECPRGDWLLGIAERLGALHARSFAQRLAVRASSSSMKEETP